MGHVDWAAVALKGLVERGDVGAYFGESGATTLGVEKARELGWVRGDWPNLGVTEAGRAYYAATGLGALPREGHPAAWVWKMD